MRPETHLSDRDLLLATDGELSPESLRRVQQHLAGCNVCQVRKQQIDQASASFTRLHRTSLDPEMTPVGTARAALRSRLAGAPPCRENAWPHWQTAGACAAVVAMLGICVLAFWLDRRGGGQYSQVVSVPNPTLTPGLAVPVSQRQICAVENAKNRLVPVSLRRLVFQEYGIPNAAPPAYEVDYLITPALGGADDIRNLWPQSYSSTVWNAQVKDALEDRLRELVCEGKLDLATAQRDIAADWIGAYKKYFRSELPVELRSH